MIDALDLARRAAGISKAFIQRKKAALRYRARHNGIEMTLASVDVLTMLLAPCCAYCANPFTKTGDGRVSIERMNPLKGYTKENTCAACIGCNSRKALKDERRHRLHEREQRRAQLARR